MTWACLLILAACLPWVLASRPRVLGAEELLHTDWAAGREASEVSQTEVSDALVPAPADHIEHIEGLAKHLDTLKALRNFTFGTDMLGVPLPMPPEGSGECLSRTFVLHFEGAKDRLMAHSRDAHADQIMVAICIGSTIVMCFGHMLITPVLAMVSGAVAFFFVFATLLIATQSCKVPVWGGAIAMVPVMLAATRILALGFFALGAALGLILSSEGQSIALRTFPKLEERLREDDLLQYSWLLTAFVAACCGALLMGQVHTITMLATAMVGAFGLEHGMRGLLVSYDKELSDTEASLCIFAFFFVGVLVQMKLATCSRK